MPETFQSSFLTNLPKEFQTLRIHIENPRNKSLRDSKKEVLNTINVSNPFTS